MFEIKKELARLPERPGVYLMKNSELKVIYVGKAKSLKNRVSQYFQSSKNHTQKVLAMVENIVEFEYIVTDTEMEALILECNLIKEYKPKYNIIFRDDKTYPYIKVTVNEEYPRVLKVRRVSKDKARYFGPYTSEYAVKNVMDLIQKTYRLRTCKRDISRMREKKERPCLNFFIGKCSGPCSGENKKEEYDKKIEEILDILSGKVDDLIDELSETMAKHSSNLEFEEAASCRDRIRALKELGARQKIVNIRDIDQDVLGVYKEDDTAAIQIFFMRGGKIIGRESHIIKDVSGDSKPEILLSFIKQFYISKNLIPKEILVPFEMGEEEIIEEYLSGIRGQKVAVRIPQKGEKRNLIEMVENNAKETLHREFSIKKIKEKQQVEVVESIKAMLGMEKMPKRIEAYDISNIQGVDSVGSMVVYINGRKAPKEYRRFRIKSVEGQDDYSSMSEIIRRRLKRSDQPDLILLDGGKGHVSTIDKLLKEIGVEIPLWGMAKDDKHRTRGLVSLEQEIELDRRTPVYKFIAGIQEEVHRFAIDYHRTLRKENIKKSVLDEIPGIGEKRKLELLINFKTIDAIRRASVEELSSVKGMNKSAAKNIYDFFRRNL